MIALKIQLLYLTYQHNMMSYSLRVKTHPVIMKLYPQYIWKQCGF